MTSLIVPKKNEAILNLILCIKSINQRHVNEKANDEKKGRQQVCQTLSELN